MIGLNLFIDAFATIIAREEGWEANGRMPSIPQRLNNPIDLPSWKTPRGTPYPELNGYVNFPQCHKDNCQHNDHPAELGWAAARAQCKINIVKRQLTFREFFVGRRSVYGGFLRKGDRTDPLAYASRVFRAVKTRFQFGEDITIDTPIHTLIELGGANGKRSA